MSETNVERLCQKWEQVEHKHTDRFMRRMRRDLRAAIEADREDEYRNYECLRWWVDTYNPYELDRFDAWVARQQGEDDGEPPPTRMERLMWAECDRHVNNGDILPKEKAAFIMGWTACQSAMREGENE